MKNLKIIPRSIIKKGNLRRVDISAYNEKSTHYNLSVYKGKECVAKAPFALSSGDSTATLWLRLPDEDFEARFVISDISGNTVSDTVSECKKARKWTIYVTASSHTDIGLHNSQYIQRFNSSKFIDKAIQLCDETKDREPDSQYHYMMEGSWFLSNYIADRSKENSDRLINEYIKKGRLGVCAGVAGNHTQTFGFEEMCRAAYSRKWLKKYGIDSKTMTMIDNNGMSWSMVTPFAKAGYENIIFAPNQWNPLPSTVWKRDSSVYAYTWNTEAGGGGSRIDVRYESALPMLFYWQGAYGEKMLVWASTAYFNGGHNFGIEIEGIPINETEEKMAKQLTLMDERYPYDVWLVEAYTDDQEPDLAFCDRIGEWNSTYEYPKLKMLGNADEPFNLVRERFDSQIPVLSGDITGGWYQHPLSAADLLADKQEADRRLANAEKLATVAACLNDEYKYPKSLFNKAWASLIMNDEHSYGTSGYQGRRVYETWLQHRDWIENARDIADSETRSALKAIADKVKGSGKRVLAFNPAAFERTEKLTSDGECSASLPPFGYKVISAEEFNAVPHIKTDISKAPTIENGYYRVKFADNGSIAEIYDKKLEKTLNSGNCNEFMYTADNHVSFKTPEKARFTVEESSNETAVHIYTCENTSGAEIVQTVTLPNCEKRIDIDNRLYHVRDMVNSDRYYRYAYFAFPFAVENCRRYCELGGAKAEYGVDITGHGTDVYMAAHEYCCVDDAFGKYGIGLIQLDSQLVEFDHIHPDKTDFGNSGGGSAVYSYLANDWLQMYLPGGSSLDYRFRYTIVSYEGTHISAGLNRIAERAANPIITLSLDGESGGILPEKQSFLESDARFIGLKSADDGRGLIAHFYSEKEPTAIKTVFGDYSAATVDEYEEKNITGGYFAIRIGAEKIKTELRPERQVSPLEIGGVETGLVTAPRSARGENDGMLYILWGKCKSPDVAYYELFRGNTPDFTADSTTLIAKPEPEEYVVGRYIDNGLKTNTRYYYRVRAVDKNGEKGPLSKVFSALTKE